MLLLDGQPPTAEALAALMQSGWGHYTSFLLQDGVVLGLEAHRLRLIRDAQAVLGVTLEAAQVQAALAPLQGLRGQWSVRIDGLPRALDLRAPETLCDLHWLLRASPWSAVPAPPLALQCVTCTREAAAHKHLALGSALQARQQARRAGADDALLCTPDGALAEGPTWNLAVFDGTRLCWPDGPALAGVTQGLWRQVAAHLGVAGVQRRLTLDDLYTARCVWTCNARQPLRVVRAVDGRMLNMDPQPLARFAQAWGQLAGESL